MGKTRGHGSRRGAYRGARNASKGRGGGDEEDSSEEEEYEQPRGLGACAADAGVDSVSDMHTVAAARAGIALRGRLIQTGSPPFCFVLACLAHTGAQRSNVGMLPPSDSDEDEGEEGGEKPAKESSKAAGSSAKGGQSKNAGKLPPSDSEDEEDDDSEEESSEEPLNEYLASSAPRKK